mmetsp:Transcript_18199/g.59991  ORF Transcript_18199/g.59991 Transcript_18199/m.59991 type:complete len:439 (+) Transcript_18199:1062-2378(+)
MRCPLHGQVRFSQPVPRRRRGVLWCGLRCFCLLSGVSGFKKESVLPSTALWVLRRHSPAAALGAQDTQSSRSRPETPRAPETPREPALLVLQQQQGVLLPHVVLDVGSHPRGHLGLEVCLVLHRVPLRVVHERLGGEHRARDRGCVLERPRRDRSRVTHARLQQVLVLQRLCVEAVPPVVVGNLLPHERAEQPRVVCDLHHRRPHRRDEHVYRDPLVRVRDRGARLVGEASDVREAGPASRHHALDDRPPHRVDRVLVPQLLVHNLGLGRRANLDARDGGAELVDALLDALHLELLVGLLHELLLEPLELVNPRVHVRLVRAVGDEERLRLLDLDAGEGAELREGGLLHLHLELVGDQSRAAEGADVGEEGLLHVPEAGALDGADVEHAAVQVEDEGRQRLHHHVLCDEEQRPLRLDHRLEHRQQLVDRRELDVCDED